MNGMFKGKTYGAVTIGERGQLVIPAQLRRALKIKSGNQLMVFAKLDKRIINLMSATDFSRFLERAERFITKLENKIPRRH